MAIFTLGAQILDAVIIKTTIFTIEQVTNIVLWSGRSVYHYYYPVLSETDMLKEKVLMLEYKVKTLEVA